MARRHRAAALGGLALAAVTASLTLGHDAGAATSHNPTGHVDSVVGTSGGQIVSKGWAYDPDAPSSVIAVDVYIDGHGFRVHTGIARPDVAKAIPGAGPNTGFSATSGVQTWGAHQVCIYAINVDAGSNVQLGCRSVTLVDPHNPKGTFSASLSGSTATASGYAYDPDTTSAIQVNYRVDSGAWASVIANRSTPSAPVSGSHGYQLSVTIPEGTHQLCAYAMNVGAGSTNPTLGCKELTRDTLNQQIAAYAKTFVGKYPYRDGGTSPSTGFDCSGLTQYIYAQYGKAIPRTAAEQAAAFKTISVNTAQPGDLVFFHDGSGYVFHVGVYEGGGMMVAAADVQDGIRYQSVWSTAVTYGTILH